MASASHTGGRWKTSRGGTLVVSEVEVINPHTGHIEVLEQAIGHCMTGRYVKADAARANASLFAASPALLKAAKAIVDEVCAVRVADDCRPGPRLYDSIALRDLRAAIALTEPQLMITVTAANETLSDKLDAAGVREGQRRAASGEVVKPVPYGTRAEHLEWCKARAREYLDRDQWDTAWPSFVSDMTKHAELRGHIALELGVLQVLGGHLKDTAGMRAFIEGFN